MPLVTNLFRPGGNLTGLSFLNTEVSSKRLEILVEAVPNVQRIAVFADPTASQSFVEATVQAAKRLGVLPQIINVPRPEALEEAFRAAVGGGAQALNVLASAFFKLIESGSRNLRWCTTFLRCTKRANMCGREA
jgi:putative ABC transport system substrate-binding protein